MTYQRFPDIFRAAGFVSVEVAMDGDWVIFDAQHQRFSTSPVGLNADLAGSSYSTKACRRGDPQTIATGGFSSISHIPRKHKPLGTELKTVCGAETSIMTYIEIQKGKMRAAKYVDKRRFYHPRNRRSSGRVPFAEFSASSARGPSSQSQSQFESQFSYFSRSSAATHLFISQN